MSQFSELLGNLQLSNGQTTGTVVVQDVSTDKILGSATVNERGWFVIENLPKNTYLKLWGFPGTTFNLQDASAALRSPPRLHYEAKIKTTTSSFASVYINGVSSIISMYIGKSIDANLSDASVRVKEYLFGKAASIFLPGYSTEFLGHIAPPSLFDRESFLAQATSAGGVANLAMQVANDIRADRVLHSFKRARNFVENTERELPTSQTCPPPPTITPSANWASNDTTWLDVLNAEDNSLASSMTAISQTTDGIAAGAATNFASFSIGDVASWATTQIGGQLASLIAGQLFSCVEQWLFGSGPSPTATALTYISTQLNTVINNQATMITQLENIEKLLNQQSLNSILNDLTPSISTIQSNSQSVYEYSNSTQGISNTSLSTIATNILDTNVGVVYAMTNIHNLIIGTSGGLSLPQALYNVSTNSSESSGYQQLFLSNNNFYLYAQSFYHFYLGVQTQGAQLITQAQNYNENLKINNTSSTLMVSQLAQGTYGTYLSIDDTQNQTPTSNIQIQREAYRTIFKPYYEAFEPYMIVSPTTAIPDDMAVCFIPKVLNQTHEIFYSVSLKALVIGTISFAIRNWTNSTDAIGAQTVIRDAQSWILPTVFAGQWQLPSYDQLVSLITPANQGADYNGNYYQYLQAQGFNDDSAIYGVPNFKNSTNVTIWTLDFFDMLFAAYAEASSIINAGNNYPPYDTNGNEIIGQAINNYAPGYKTPYGFNLPSSETDNHLLNTANFPPPPVAHWTQWECSYPIVVPLQNNLNLSTYSWCSSSAYSFSDANNAPSVFPPNQVFGGMLFVFL